MDTVKKLREQATKCEQKREESFQRSDTDGFLTQWASSLTAQLHRAQAEILENGGTAEFVGLYEGDRRVKARVIDTPYGYSWLLHADEKTLRARRGRPFLPTGPRSRVLKSLGLRERAERAPAYARIDGEGTGFSGSCWVAIHRDGASWGEDAMLSEE